MLTKEKVGIELDRVAEKLGTRHFRRTEYDAVCREGYSIYLIKRDLGLTFNEIKEEFNFPTLNPGTPKGSGNYKPLKNKTPKVFCKRGEGDMINWKTQCFPGNDACQTCPHPNESNRVVDNSLSKEEEFEQRYTSNTEGGYTYSHANYT